MRNKILVLTLLAIIATSPLTSLRAQEIQADQMPESRSEDVNSFTQKIPRFLRNAYSNVYNALEGWRIKTLADLQAKKAKIDARQQELDQRVDESDVLEGDTMTPKGFLRPMEYLEKTFYTGLEAVFKNPTVFYGIIIMILLILIVRIFG